MKKEITLATIVLLLVMAVNAQNKTTETFLSPGMLSIGTRNTFSIFNDDNATGIGIGGQARVQLSNRIGSEWFFDYITSKNGTSTIRNDYHIGWSLMYYPIKDRETPTFLQPYIIAGHCFDYSKVAEQGNSNNYADRWSIATQAGIGTHFNITNRFDCSLSSNI